ncbi:hydrogenase maturation protease [Ammoniphilus resinae]|uniref:Hydrogenase maturation protease n=1 Tax=Ammoniphilus resinae TaxID=861532 RepID=A0ABS4GLH5_9BACL|nr:hydrogenase maturation protease [Ammoniphilus resinae]MBP1931096.1 hydrogenase maturation protease [Ammoniphilus resinae]
MKPIVVIGIGSRLMMDDGIGINVVEALAKQMSKDQWVDYEVGETDLEYCLERMIGAEFLIVVDAAFTGKKTGEVSVIPLSEIVTIHPGISQHNLHVLEILRTLDEEKKGVMIGIEPFQIDFHLGLSSELNEIFDQVVCEVKDTIEVIKTSIIENIKI